MLFIKVVLSGIAVLFELPQSVVVEVISIKSSAGE